MKHTQGEWIDLGYRVDIEIADGLSGICEMSDWMGNEEMEANARLVAAAPELLKGLIDACERMSRCRGILQDEGGNWGMLDTSSLREVIKKATEPTKTPSND